MRRNCCQKVCPECNKYEIGEEDLIEVIGQGEYFHDQGMDRFVDDLIDTGGNGGYGWGCDAFGKAVCFYCGRILLAWLSEVPGYERMGEEEWYVNDLSFYESFNDEPGSIALFANGVGVFDISKGTSYRYGREFCFVEVPGIADSERPRNANVERGLGFNDGYQRAKETVKRRYLRSFHLLTDSVQYAIVEGLIDDCGHEVDMGESTQCRVCKIKIGLVYALREYGITEEIEVL